MNIIEVIANKTVIVAIIISKVIELAIGTTRNEQERANNIAFTKYPRMQRGVNKAGRFMVNKSGFMNQNDFEYCVILPHFNRSFCLLWCHQKSALMGPNHIKFLIVFIFVNCTRLSYGCDVLKTALKWI